MHKVEALGGKVIDEPKISQGYYGATFAIQMDINIIS